MVSLEHLALTQTNDFPIRRAGDVHSGKVRSVYWLPPCRSRDLIHKGGYLVPEDTPLGVMITSDRISAFNVNWQGEHGLLGVPGKGAALNAMSMYWFEMLKREGIAEHHVLDTPHPLVWIVQKAQPVKIEAVIRAYISGSMWKKYAAGERYFCGEQIPDGLTQYQQFDRTRLTPTTKGTLQLPGIPAEEDTPISHAQIFGLLHEFGFRSREDFETYQQLIPNVFSRTGDDLRTKGELLADAKFEIGYFRRRDGEIVLGLIDEPVTQDSARIWSAKDYLEGRIIEKSKEHFRQHLIAYCDEHVKPRGRKILDGGALLPELKALAASYRVPVDTMMEVSRIYTELTEKITGKPVPTSESPREEILNVLEDLSLLR